MSLEARANASRKATPFSKGAVLAVVLVGFSAFLAMLYFIGAGDTGDPGRGGAAHASANGLNGYSGLVRLLEAEGIEVERSRSLTGLQTNGLLIIAPPQHADLQEFTEALENRQFYGPTLVLLPKWIAAPPVGEVAEEDQLRMRDDWVTLNRVRPISWTENLPKPYAFEYGLAEAAGNVAPKWTGLRRSGALPTPLLIYAKPKSGHEALVTSEDGQALVISMTDSEFYEDAFPITFVVEPDLMNNYGLADGQRAGLALDIIRAAGSGTADRVVFDMTFNGYGQTMNLLTLAFRPPFLAATLCLILAIGIVGWRAFLRFGPAALRGQAIAYGKERLVRNGAGLIVRARRLGLLADPYAQLAERRIGKALGIARPDPESIDAALAQRLPDHEPFSLLAARLHNARRPNEILRAAQALSALSKTITGNQRK